jgi:RNA polymerase sigma factor (sigma-70 family)
VLGYLHRLVDTRHAEAPDAQLIRRFVEQRDESAFEALVRRHGPLVLNTCRRLLPDPHDVDDAFQATFFVLARRAAALARPEQLAGWLHGVAVRVATKARVARARRLTHEETLADLPPAAAEATMDETLRRELWNVLDEEVARLPARYQAPFVLCYLAGKTNEEAAHELGHPSGTIFSRLARARELLRARLTRRGITLSSGMLAAALATQPADAALPASLLEATVHGSLLIAGGQTAALGSQTANALVLMREASRTMFLAKAKLAAVGILALIAAGSGVAMVSQRTASAKPQADSLVAKADAADDDALKRENENLKRDNEKLKEEIDRLSKLRQVLELNLKNLQLEVAQVTYKGKPKSYWLGQLRDLDEATRINAISALGAIAEEDPSVLPALAELLKKKNLRDRVIAIFASLGPEAKSVLPELLKLVGTSTQLQPTLGLIDPQGKTCVPALLKKLRDNKVNVRMEAARWLAYYGSSPELGGGVFDGVQIGAGEVRAKIVAALIEASKDREAEVRCEAVLSLAEIGARARAAVPQLVLMLKNQETVTARTVSPIEKPKPHTAGPGLTVFPIQRNPEVSTVGEAAAYALRRIDPKAAKEAGVKFPE